jgi:hypothetical protein
MMKKRFDCVEMKRRIQAKIYAETKEMSQEEQIAYFQKRIMESEFASFLEKEPALQALRRGEQRTVR